MAVRTSSIGTQTEQKKLIPASHPGLEKIAKMQRAYEASRLERRQAEKAALSREILSLRHERDALRLEILQLQKENEKTKTLRDLLNDSLLPRPVASPVWPGERALIDGIVDDFEAAPTDLAGLEASCSQIT